MKPAFVMTLCLGLVIITSCDKKNNRNNGYPFVYVGKCINQSFGTDVVQLCFNEVLADSRCPANVECLLEGQAKAKFTFTQNGTPHPLVLSSAKWEAGSIKDTIVSGYKIEFVNLYPYPVLYGQTPAPPDERFAEVKITKQ